MAARLEYLVTGLNSRVALRRWDRRRDRSAMTRWPAYNPALPAHWLTPVQPVREERQHIAIAPAPGVVMTPPLVGRITLHSIEEGAARLGIALHPDMLGLGLGGEALDLLWQHAWRNLGLAALRLDVAADNRRAVACYRAAGFVERSRIWRQLDGGRVAIYLEMERRS